MFGFGYVKLLVAGTVLLLGVVVWRVGGRSAWTRVDDHTIVTVAVEALAAPFTRLPADLPSSQLRMGGRAAWTLVVHPAPWWTVIPAIMLVPVGLLFFLPRGGRPGGDAAGRAGGLGGPGAGHHPPVVRRNSRPGGR